MKASELRGRDADDLRQEIENLRRRLFDIRFKWQAEEKPDTSERCRTKRDIARIKTVLREKELAASGEADAS